MELSLALTYLGQALAAEGDLAGARPYLEEASALVPGPNYGQHLLGDVCRLEGDVATARDLHERTLAGVQAEGDRGGISLGQRCLGYALQHLGHVGGALGRPDEAVDGGRLADDVDDSQARI